MENCKTQFRIRLHIPRLWANAQFIHCPVRCTLLSSPLPSQISHVHILEEISRKAIFSNKSSRLPFVHQETHSDWFGCFPSLAVVQQPLGGFPKCLQPGERESTRDKGCWLLTVSLPCTSSFSMSLQPLSLTSFIFTMMFRTVRGERTQI